MEKIFIGVREVDKEIFERYKALALARRMKLGAALTLAMKKMLDNSKINHKKENLKKAQALLKMKPIDFGPGSEHLSEQIDEILYGLKK